MKKQTKHRAEADKWFVKVRHSYLPCSWQGWLMYVPYVVVLSYLLFPYFLWPLTCAASDPCVSVASQWVVIAANLVEVAVVVVLMTWIAKKKS